MAAEDWQIVAVADALKRASDVGETRSRAALQEECGIGAGDLEETLDVLRDRNAAWEVTPGVYSSGVEPAVDDDDPATSTGAAEAVASPAPAAIPGRPRAAAPASVEPVRVEMPMGVAGGMDAAALGSIVQSGIGQAKAEGRGFVFEARG